MIRHGPCHLTLEARFKALDRERPNVMAQLNELHRGPTIPITILCLGQPFLPFLMSFQH